jgi:hypothetical protein
MFIVISNTKAFGKTYLNSKGHFVHGVENAVQFETENEAHIAGSDAQDLMSYSVQAA